MRKKQANLYSLPSSLSSPPYLTPQQLSQFQAQFTLFDSELDLQKLKQSFSILNLPSNISQNYSQPQNYKPIDNFITSLCTNTKKTKCTFSQYIAHMNQYFAKQEQIDLLMQFLSEDKKHISGHIIKQILQQIMCRQLCERQLADILGKIFMIQNVEQSVKKQQIRNLLAKYSNNN